MSKRTIITLLVILLIVIISQIFLVWLAAPWSPSSEMVFAIQNRTSHEANLHLTYIGITNREKIIFSEDEHIAYPNGDETYLSYPDWDSVVRAFVYVEVEQGGSTYTYRIKGWTKADVLEIHDDPLRLVHIPYERIPGE